MDKMTFAHAVLSTRADWTSEDEEDFAHQYMREVTAHEVGHTLGLRHNFIASTIYSVSEVTDWTHDHLASATSVMDYSPPVVAPEGKAQGPYLPGEVGSYDKFAIRYGYSPIEGAKDSSDELEALTAIAREGAQTGHGFATDEDAGFSGRALDPRVSRFDFGADPLEWYAHTLGQVRLLWTRLDTLVEDGDSYVAVRNGFDRGWRDVVDAGLVASKYVGGVYHVRHHVGDPDGQLPFVPVPADEQRRALAFIHDELWAPGLYDDAAKVLNKVQFQRHVDLSWSVFESGRIDYPLHEVVANMQAIPLNILFQPERLARIQDVQKMDPEGLTLDELFTTVRQNIWTELGSSSTIDSHRRALQNDHLDTLLWLVLDDPGHPDDAIALARAELGTLRAQVNRAAPRMRDRISKAHLEAARDQIDASLKAAYERED
jgi:hypothetical protein